MIPWIFFLCVCGGQDLYLYLESDPDLYSDHLRDALQTPISSLRRKWPDNSAVQDYLWDLHCARHDLQETCRIHIHTRDELQIRSDQRLPAWGISRSDPLRPLHPDCFLHWIAAVEHLRYLSQIAEWDKSNNPHWNMSYVEMNGVRYRYRSDWFIRVSRKTSHTFQEGDFEQQSIEETVQFYYRFPPSPPSDLPLPQIRRVTEETRIGGYYTGSLVLGEALYNSESHRYQLLKAMDLETGIILVPVSEAPATKVSK